MRIPRSARFRILKGVNFGLSFETPSLFSIVNGSEVEVIFTGAAGLYAGAGKYKNSRMVIWPRSRLAYNYKPKTANDTLLLNNVVTYLTDWNCTNYSNCYYEIGFYKEHVGVRNLVFGARYLSFFDLADFKMNAELYQWHVLFTGRFGNDDNKEITDLLRLNGYCAGERTANMFLHSSLNLCRPQSSPRMICK